MCAQPILPSFQATHEKAAIMAATMIIARRGKSVVKAPKLRTGSAVRGLPLQPLRASSLRYRLRTRSDSPLAAHVGLRCRPVGSVSSPTLLLRGGRAGLTQLLFASDLTLPGQEMGRVAGLALLGLALACLPRPGRRDLHRDELRDYCCRTSS